MVAHFRTLMRTACTTPWGSLKIAVPVVATGEASAGSIVEVTTLGVAAYQTPLMSGITVGYNRERLMSLKNNVLVVDE